ncbi:MAG: heavy metal translocating P-type ATPase [Phocaeicola sp.]|nr:heavy metal translocating P-type ATPase [Phocaeicola sp.]
MSENKIIKESFPVLGMSCASCAARVDKTLNKQKGVCNAAVNYAAATATVEYDAEMTSPEVLQKAVQDAGYDLYIEKDDELNDLDKQREAAYQSLKRRTICAFVLSIAIMVISMFLKDWKYARIIMWLLATPVVFGMGSLFFVNAWKQLKHGSSNMDTLVASSTGIAYLFSLFNLLFPSVWTSRGIEPHVYFESSAMIIAFILLGRLLEAKAKGNTATAIKKLMGLQPKTVTIIKDNEERIIPIQQIQPDDIVLVKPGERIAVDGLVVSGSSYVDESMLSGEPMAVRKAGGNKVFAGTLNQKGSFRFKAEKVGSDTLLAKIIRMVQDAQGSKAPVQQLVDKVASIFVPTIICIAIIACLCWLLLDSHNGISHGILALVTVLIIACPCALGLATPTAIMVGIGKGAEHGILIKDAESLEIAKQIDTVVLDKTGTITEGKPQVTSIKTIFTDPKRAEQLLGMMESLSEHPLADAIVSYIQQERQLNTQDIVIEDFENIPGKGIQGREGQGSILIGNRKLMDEKSVLIPFTLEEAANQMMQRAETVIWFAQGKEAKMVLGISDRIKESSVKAIRLLQDNHIRVVMLTGDNEHTAKAIAQQAGIRSYQANTLPEDKVRFIQDEQAAGHKIAMVGDGINDSAALAQADLSIAMGDGSDIAMDVAKMTIISSDLTKIPEAFKLSRLTTKTIRQNLFWAFFYNVIAVPIAAGILYPINGFLLNPMIGGIAMAFSSVSVVGNSLLLKRKKIGEETEIHQESINNTVMKKEFKVEGMMCMHCRMHVEKALNSIEGVKATVTLDPPVATVEFEGEAKSLDELQKVVTEEAGDYKLSE